MGLLWSNVGFALSLSKDVASGNTYKKSLDKKCKKYGMQIVDKKDAHPVRAGKTKQKIVGNLLLPQ